MHLVHIYIYIYTYCILDFLQVSHLKHLSRLGSNLGIEFRSLSHGGVPHLGSIPIRVLAAELQPWLSLQPSPRHSWPIRFQWPNVPIIFTITQHKRGVPHGRQHMPIVKKGQVLVFASIWKLQDLHKSHGRSISSTTRNSIYFDILSWFSP